jgi:hypothetical protein
MAGQRGLVSVSEITSESVSALRGRLAPQVMDALGTLCKCMMMGCGLRCTCGSLETLKATPSG